MYAKTIVLEHVQFQDEALQQESPEADSATTRIIGHQSTRDGEKRENASCAEATDISHALAKAGWFERE